MAVQSHSTYGMAVLGATLTSTCALAAHADREGLDAVWAGEFYERSERCRVGSPSIYGVGRTPLVLASDIRDLDELSGGRLVVGLGNGTRRMINDWHGQDPEAPALRMEELVPL